MKKIIVASNNKHKIDEIKAILSGLEYEIISLKEANINVDVDETGTTFMENAMIKASEIFNLLNYPEDILVMADDSGLCVDILDGAPGVFSARFAGEHGNDSANNEKLLELLKDENKNRNAKFVCAIALIGKDEVIQAEGYVEGKITEKLEGSNGFGYDPLFLVPQFNRTFAQLTEDEKNSISHRGRALEILKSKL